MDDCVNLFTELIVARLGERERPVMDGWMRFAAGLHPRGTSFQAARGRRGDRARPSPPSRLG